MAHLKTTYIEGDLYVQNSLRVSDYKTTDGSILAIVEGIDKDFNGELDDYADKLVVFKDNKGKIGKSYLRIGNPTNLDAQEYPDAEGKKFYTLKFDPTGYQTGLILEDSYSGDIKLKSTPIYLHEGDSPNWNYIFSGSVQDVTYKEKESYTLIVVAKSENDDSTKDVIYTGSGLLVDDTININIVNYKGYEISEYRLKFSKNGVSIDPKKLSSGTTIKTIKVDSSKTSLNDFKLDGTNLVIPHVDTEDSSAVYYVDVILGLTPRQIYMPNESNDSVSVNISIESTIVFNPTSYKVFNVLDGDKLTEREVTFADNKKAVRYILKRKKEDGTYEEIASYLPNSTTWGLANVFEDVAEYTIEAIFSE